MANQFEVSLKSWLDSLNPSEKNTLREFHCEMLACLKHVQPDLNLLYAAVCFWDPTTHCFCFRDHEISPLPEELGAIISWPCEGLPCLPNMSDYFHNDFERFLGFDSSALREIFHGREVNLIALVDYFKTLGPSHKVYRRRALIYCLFACFLFVGDNPAIGNASIITIVEQCEAGRSPMPLCVGELHTSLDRLKRDPKAPLKGCPLLLQIWLMERLNFVEPPRNPEKYDLKGYFGRKRIYANQSQHDWSLKLIDRQTRIRSVIPWWRIKSMVHALEAPHVRVASLTCLSFYFPCRVMRQYGRKQWIPQTDTPRPEENPIMASNVRSWEVYWQRLPRLEAKILKPGDERVSKHYSVWMSSTMAAQRAEARKAERIAQKEGVLLQDDAECSSSNSKTTSVKDRLGPKRAPVWERLEEIVEHRRGKKRRKEKSQKKGGQTSEAANPNAVEEPKEKEKLD